MIHHNVLYVTDRDLIGGYNRENLSIFFFILNFILMERIDLAAPFRQYIL